MIAQAAPSSPAEQLQLMQKELLLLEDAIPLEHVMTGFDVRQFRKRVRGCTALDEVAKCMRTLRLHMREQVGGIALARDACCECQESPAPVSLAFAAEDEGRWVGGCGWLWAVVGGGGAC